jgi:hypothetical protein
MFKTVDPLALGPRVEGGSVQRVLPRFTLYSPYMAIFQFIWPNLVQTHLVLF